MPDIQIPCEAVEAAARAVYEAFCRFHGVTATSMPWHEIADEEEGHQCFAQAEAALRAGLKAWPNAWINCDLEKFRQPATHVVLPLPQDTNDE